jgi:DNA polymerase (family 10)
MRNPYVDILGHPSGRLLGRREPSRVDLERVLRVAAETGTILEINAMPERLDLDGLHVRRAIDLGAKVSINSDAHSTDGLQVMLFGVATARRGWAEPPTVVNSLPLSQLRHLIAENRARRHALANSQA